MSRLASGAAAAALAVAIVLPAHAQERRREVTISPYIEVEQVLEANLQDSDVLTYTEVAAGVNAAIRTRRVEMQLNYRFQKRFAYDDGVPDSTVHSGIATAQATITPGFTMEAGAMATRARSDIRGAAPGGNAAIPANTSQLYSAYVGPNVSTNVGPMFVNGAYRFGYTKAEEPNVPSDIEGEGPIDIYDDSKVHVATASVGVKAGDVLPVGLTASAGYTREDAGQLDQRYEGKFGRGDVVAPVSRDLALTAGVGYESIQVSQRDPLLDEDEDPVRDGAGRFVTDPKSPRRLAYDLDGIFWDAGVIWRPSTRTQLEARFGRRYDSWSFTGSFSHQIGPESGVQIGVYDSVTSFGQQVNNGLAGLPTSFATANGPFGNQFNSCVFGRSGATAGSCFNATFASMPTANYRARGVVGVLSLARGPNEFGFGGGYERRSFIAPESPDGFSVDGLTDEAYFVEAYASRAMGRNGRLIANAYASYFTTDLPGTDNVIGWGANTTYTRNFGRLGAVAALGLYGFEGQGDQSNVSAQALVGLNYGF